MKYFQFVSILVCIDAVLGLHHKPRIETSARNLTGWIKQNDWPCPIAEEIAPCSCWRFQDELTKLRQSRVFTLYF